MLAAVLASIDAVRSGYERDFLAGRIDFSGPRDGSPGLPGVFAHLKTRLSPERSDQLRARLRSVFDEFLFDEESEDAVIVNLFTLMYETTPMYEITPPTAE